MLAQVPDCPEVFMVRRLFMCCCFVALLQLLVVIQANAQQPGASPTPLPSSAGTAYVIKAGKLIDPESGTATANQMISVKDGRIVEIGAKVAVPQAVEIIDLLQYSVLPGLVDAHNHLALTYKKV